jgi:hypothetical protein
MTRLQLFVGDDTWHRCGVQPGSASDEGNPRELLSLMVPFTWLVGAGHGVFSLPRLWFFYEMLRKWHFVEAVVRPFLGFEVKILLLVAFLTRRLCAGLSVVTGMLSVEVKVNRDVNSACCVAILSISTFPYIDFSMFPMATEVLQPPSDGVYDMPVEYRSFRNALIKILRWLFPNRCEDLIVSLQKMIRKTGYLFGLCGDAMVVETRLPSRECSSTGFAKI